jgi:hypothetical protein
VFASFLGIFIQKLIVCKNSPFVILTKEGSASKRIDPDSSVVGMTKEQNTKMNPRNSEQWIASLQRYFRIPLRSIIGATSRVAGTKAISIYHL